MCDKSYDRYRWVQQQLETDAEYQHLMERFWANEPDFKAALADLSQEQQMAVMEYIGVHGELAERAIEIACTAP